MENIQYASAYTEGQIMDAVFTASRTNEMRSTYTQNKLGKLRVTVRFVSMSLQNSMFKATVYDTNGFEIGSAIVDKWDI